MIERRQEKEPHKFTTGIVLTAGWEISDNLVIRPDAEGRIRVMAAAHDFNAGIINQIYMLGGAEFGNSGIPVSNLYVPYAIALLKIPQNSSPVWSMPGGLETGSDLTTGLKKYHDLKPSLRIYSTSYHLGRVALIIRSLGIKAVLVKAEKLVAQESDLGKFMVNNTIDQDFLEKMYKREEAITNILGVLDHNPFIPFSGKVRLGSRLIEIQASRMQKQAA